jgi:hypothetical protein
MAGASKQSIHRLYEGIRCKRQWALRKNVQMNRKDKLRASKGTSFGFFQLYQCFTGLFATQGVLQRTGTRDLFDSARHWRSQRSRGM